MLKKLNAWALSACFIACFQLQSFSQKSDDKYKYTSLGFTVDQMRNASCPGVSYERSYRIGSYYMLGTQESYTGGIPASKFDYGFNHPRLYLFNASLANTLMLADGAKFKAFVFLRTGVSIMNDYNKTGKIFNPPSAGYNYNLLNEPGIRVSYKTGPTNVFLEAGYRFYNARYHFGQASDFNGLRFTIGLCGFREK